MTNPHPETEAAEVKRLEAELAEVRKRRIGMQRAAAEAPGLLTAIERVERDRSALSTVEVEELRQRVQHLHDDLVESWDGVDRQRYMVALLRRRFLTDYTLIDEAFAQEAQTRIEAARQGDAAGIPLNVPPPLLAPSSAGRGTAVDRPLPVTPRAGGSNEAGDA